LFIIIIIIKNKQEVLGRTNYLLSFETTRTAKVTIRPTINFVAFIFFAAETFLTSLATIVRDTDTRTDGRDL
jgi:hypothetical protein